MKKPEIKNKGFYIPAESKIYIKISSNTFHILRNDSECFIEPIRPSNTQRISATVINRIIHGYDVDAKTVEQICTEKNDECTFYIKLDKSSTEIMKTVDGETASRYEGFASRYISALMEKYASLPYVEREKVFFSDYIKKVYAAKEAGELLLISYKGRSVRVIPYCVRMDEWSSYNYLIGYDADNTDKLVNFRIAYISSLNSRKNSKEGYYITPEMENNILQKIDECGIQFITGKPIEIKVRLTSYGKSLYDHIVFMRPAIYKMPEPNDNEYTFFCTELQAENYFRRLYYHAEITSPKSLRKIFQKEARKLYTIYSKKNDANKGD